MQTNPDKETFEAWHDDPRNWKLWIFYYNKEDPRLFPPKRLKGLGWTLNFANPASIAILSAIVMLGIVIIYIARH